jgi:hypothetical protein
MAKQNSSDEEEKSSDPRVVATSAISGGMVAALAVCIPLVAILRSPMVVFVVIGGAALAIAGVWNSGKSKGKVKKSTEIAALESTIEDLKERLENVEVMNRFEEALAEKALREGAEGGENSPRTMGPKAE